MDLHPTGDTPNFPPTDSRYLSIVSEGSTFGNVFPLHFPKTTIPTPPKARAPSKLPAFDAARHFWPKVDKSAGPNSCWLWTGRIDVGNGYGRMMSVNGLPYAHRMAWELAHGRKIAKGRHAAHSCNRKTCVNPAHIKAQKPIDNARAAQRDGLLTGKLKPETVLEIIRGRFDRGLSYLALAEMHSVCPQTISNICKGRTWSKLTGIAKPEKQTRIKAKPKTATFALRLVA